MKNLLVLLLFVTSFAYSQNSNYSTYKYGYNGIELIIKKRLSTTIVSTFNAKKEIKEEVAQKVYEIYRVTSPKNGETIVINTNDAKVTGKLLITNRKKLTSLNFYYESVEWNNGELEVYLP